MQISTLAGTILGGNQRRLNATQIKGSIVLSLSLAEDTNRVGDGITSKSALTGTAEPAGRVTISNGSAEIATIFADQDGRFSFDPNFSDGVYTITASQAGPSNSQETAQLNFRIDTQAPTVALVRLSDVGNLDLPIDGMSGAPVINAAVGLSRFDLNIVTTGVETGMGLTARLGILGTPFAIDRVVQAFPGNPVGDGLVSLIFKATNPAGMIFQQAPDGLYTLSVDVADLAGNSAPQYTKHVLVDTTADTIADGRLAVDGTIDGRINKLESRSIEFNIQGLDEDISKAFVRFTDGAHIRDVSINHGNGSYSADLSNLNGIVSSSLYALDIHSNSANIIGNSIQLDMGVSPGAFGTFIYSQQNSIGAIYALYDGLIGQAPDLLSLEGIFSSLKSGLLLHDLALELMASPQGQSRAGALDNGTFIEQLYQANLHRASDPSGKADWVSRLEHGTSRAEVALGFAFSDEHVANLKGVFDAGVFVPDANASQVARLYHGILDRAPDAGGLQSHIDTVAQGTPLKAVAQAFLASDEYEVRTTGLTDDQFVDTMYGNVLGRAGDSAGLQAWHAYLAQGGGRGGVIDGFTDSMEFQSKYAAVSNITYVEALYERVLGREADSGGLSNWTSPLDANAMSRTDVAHVFSASAEFQTKYVAPSNASFVESLYASALGRHADASGLQIWTNALAHGTSRADVALGIAQSPEAQQHLVGQIEAGWHFA